MVGLSRFQSKVAMKMIATTMSSTSVPETMLMAFLVFVMPGALLFFLTIHDYS